MFGEQTFAQLRTGFRKRGCLLVPSQTENMGGNASLSGKTLQNSAWFRKYRRLLIASHIENMAENASISRNTFENSAGSGNTGVC